MKTREQMYAREAAELLRDISMYRVLTEEQLLRLLPGTSARQKDKIRELMEYLVKQNRVWLCEKGYYCVEPDALDTMDKGLFSAVWILTDFIEQVEYHSVGDYPAKIIFLADGEVYEIVHAAQGKETLLAHVLASSADDHSHYLVLVDDAAQIEGLELPHVTAYCTVSEDGEVQYYQKE